MDSMNWMQSLFNLKYYILQGWNMANMELGVTVAMATVEQVSDTGWKIANQLTQVWNEIFGTVSTVGDKSGSVGFFLKISKCNKVKDTRPQVANSEH